MRARGICRRRRGRLANLCRSKVQGVWGFRVSGLGFRVQGLRCRSLRGGRVWEVWGLGFGVMGLGFRVQGLGLKPKPKSCFMWVAGKVPLASWDLGFVVDVERGLKKVSRTCMHGDEALSSPLILKYAGKKGKV